MPFCEWGCEFVQNFLGIHSAGMSLHHPHPQGVALQHNSQALLIPSVPAVCPAPPPPLLGAQGVWGAQGEPH